MSQQRESGADGLATMPKVQRRETETSVLGHLLRGGPPNTKKAGGVPRLFLRPSKTVQAPAEEVELSPTQDLAFLSSAKLATRRATLGSVSNTSNEDLQSRRASVSSWTSSLDLLTALQSTPSALATDRKGRVDLLSALRSDPDENDNPRYNGRRHSAISLASSVGGVDLISALRDGPRAPVVPRKNGSPRSSISSAQATTTTLSGYSIATTTAPLLPSPSPHRYSGPNSPTPSSLSILSRPGSLAEERRSSQAVPAFAALRRRAALSRSDLAAQLIAELAFAAAEHACAPTANTARELDTVAREVADSHAVGVALTAALTRGGYGPLALCTPAEAARLWRDLGGPETLDDEDDDAPNPMSLASGAMERLGSADSGRSEELLDEGRRRWTAWQRSQGEA